MSDGKTSPTETTVDEDKICKDCKGPLRVFESSCDCNACNCRRNEGHHRKEYLACPVCIWKDIKKYFPDK